MERGGVARPFRSLFKEKGTEALKATLSVRVTTERGSDKKWATSPVRKIRDLKE